MSELVEIKAQALLKALLPKIVSSIRQIAPEVQDVSKAVNDEFFNEFEELLSAYLTGEEEDEAQDTTEDNTAWFSSVTQAADQSEWTSNQSFQPSALTVQG